MNVVVDSIIMYNSMSHIYLKKETKEMALFIWGRKRKHSRLTHSL